MNECMHEYFISGVAVTAVSPALPLSPNTPRPTLPTPYFLPDFLQLAVSWTGEIRRQWAKLSSSVCYI